MVETWWRLASNYSLAGQPLHLSKPVCLDQFWQPKVVWEQIKATKTGPPGPVLAAKSGPNLPKVVLGVDWFWQPKVVLGEAVLVSE